VSRELKSLREEFLVAQRERSAAEKLLVRLIDPEGIALEERAP
jgi:hypothetical protein